MLILWITLVRLFSIILNAISFESRKPIIDKFISKNEN